MSRKEREPVTHETGPIFRFDLADDDLSALPASLREKIADAFVPGEAPGTWTLVGTTDTELGGLFRRMIARLSPIAGMYRRELTESNIELMVRSILADAPRPDVRAELEMDNARLRADYLRETQMLSGAQVRAASGRNPKNLGEPASRWKREGRVFAVRYGGRDLYPAFQFADGQPRPVIKEILSLLPASVTPWQIAMWFSSGNAWLDGAEPRERLDEPGEVLEAARRLAGRTEG